MFRSCISRATSELIRAHSNFIVASCAGFVYEISDIHSHVNLCSNNIRPYKNW